MNLNFVHITAHTTSQARVRERDGSDSSIALRMMRVRASVRVCVCVRGYARSNFSVRLDSIAIGVAASRAKGTRALWRV